MAKSLATPVDQGLLAKLAGRAEQEAADLSGAGRFTPPYMSVGQVKERTGQRNIVIVHNPEVRDENNKATQTSFESVEAVLLGHIMARRLRYTAPDGKLRTELASFGPSKGAVAVGTAIGGFMAWEDVKLRWPNGFPRDVIEYMSDTVTHKDVKVDSRLYAVFGLKDDEVREAAGSDIAMMFLPMTSVYGATMLDAREAAPDRSRTLMAFPDKSDPHGHKGILHTLKSRPWQFGLDNGLSEEQAARTPQNAVWLTITGGMLGDVPRPVPAFDIGDELDAAHLAWADESRERAYTTLTELIAQDIRDAYPGFAEAQRKQVALAATVGQWDQVASGMRAAVPVSAEIVDEPQDASAEPGQVATVVSRGREQSIDDEFPEESDLPFDFPRAGRESRTGATR